MVNNSKADGTRTLTIQLGQPAQGANLGFQSVHRVTITDDDDAPAFKTSPADHLVKVGDAVTLTATGPKTGGVISGVR